MNGIERTERFFSMHLKTVLRNTLLQEFDNVSVAYLGEGSEILGYDDHISEDHNFWPRVNIFYINDDFDAETLSKLVLSKLPQSFEGYPLQNGGPYVTVSFHRLHRFLKNYLSVLKFPLCQNDWITVDEQRLVEISAATTLHDPTGQLAYALSQIAEFPNEIRLFLIYRALDRISEVGGIERSILRNDWFTTKFYFMNYSYFAIRIMHLLERVYCPYRKWMMRSLREIGGECAVVADRLLSERKVFKIHEYRHIVLDRYQIIRKQMIDGNLYSVSENEKSESLKLLHLPGLEEMMLTVKEALPESLQKIPSHVQPPAFWGQLFDYTGYGVEFKKVLADNLDIVNYGT
jgi:hypothetical protein